MHKKSRGRQYCYYTAYLQNHQFKVTLFCLQCSSYGFLIVDKRDKRFLALFCSRDDDPSDQHEANIAPDQYTWNRRTNISPGKRRLIDIPLQMFVPFVCAQSELLTVT